MNTELKAAIKTLAEENPDVNLSAIHLDKMREVASEYLKQPYGAEALTESRAFLNVVRKLADLLVAGESRRFVKMELCDMLEDMVLKYVANSFEVDEEFERG